MSRRAILGDFLGVAHEQLDPPVIWEGTGAPGRDLAETSTALRRMIAVSSQYVGDILTAYRELPRSTRRQQPIRSTAAGQVLEALAGAAAVLEAEHSAGPPGRRAIHSLARRLDDASGSLTVGRDLLQTHFDQHRGTRHYRSRWAPVIVSPAVSEALFSEITYLSGRAALTGAQIPAAFSQSAMTAPVAERVIRACRGLTLAGALARASHQANPEAGVCRDLLYAIPGSALPGRPAAGGRLSVPELCQAITDTSERAAQAAWVAARLEPWSPSISVSSWRRIAAAGIATSHHCHVVLAILANRTSHLGSAELSKRLKAAASQVWLTRDSWRLSARYLNDVTTEVKWRVSEAATDASDLAVLTGRLAYADPGWTLASGPDQPARPAAQLARTPEDVFQVLAAVHYAADSFAWLARANLEQARAAGRQHRVLVPDWGGNPGASESGLFVPATEDRVHALKEACAGVSLSTAGTAEVLAGIASEVRAPSRLLGPARTVTEVPRRRSARINAGEKSGQAGDGEEPDGPLQTRLREIGVTSQEILRRAARIDKRGSALMDEALAERLSRDAAAGASYPGVAPREGLAGREPPLGHQRPVLDRHAAQTREQELEAEP